MGLSDTPRANRLHIGVFGRRNSGKSSLVNALTGQDLSLVSDEPGTTTDPVEKSMEMHPIGPVVFIDTAGFDDEGSLGELRVKKTRDVIAKTDIAILLIDDEAVIAGDLALEKRWYDELKRRGLPVIVAVNSRGGTAAGAGGAVSGDVQETVQAVVDLAPETPIIISAETGEGLDDLREAIERSVPEEWENESVLADLTDEGDLVLLVMPQDAQAPKGRLILPQVQTLRELLDRGCTSICTTPDGLAGALSELSRAPDLIITDSQCFSEVYDKKPQESRLTSFSIMFAASKGDIDTFVKGALSLDDMTEKSRILIAESCTHVPLGEDIGREKIPRLLRKKLGDGVEIRNVCGGDFPSVEELAEYDLVIHCGACMFNRRHVMSRISRARAAGVPITNYGVVLARLSGILDKISLPRSRW